MIGCAYTDDYARDPALSAPLVGKESLLSASSDARYACETSRLVTPSVPTVSFGNDEILFRRGDDMFVFMTENDAESDFSARLVVASIDRDGNIGETRIIAKKPAGWINSVQMVERDGSVMLLWLESNPDEGSSIRIATLDDNLEVVDGPHTVLGIEQDIDQARSAPADRGLALIWTQRESLTERSLSFAMLDESGQMTDEPRVVFRSDKGLRLGEFVRFRNRYAATYDEVDEPGSGYFVVLDEEGMPHNGPLRLGRNANGESLLVRGDEVLVAYTLFGSPYLGADGAHGIRLASFGLDGNRKGQVRAVDSAASDRFLMRPRFIPFGDDIALLWSEGTVIHECGGCMPDNLLKFVVLDGTGGKLVSKPIELINPLDRGGLVRSQGIWNDEDLLLLTKIAFHTTAQLASATIHCEATSEP
ncbi:MAG: hypothetical protein JXA30_19150 [Deltaproteobacteria bacterium]|nr:hypothetical protein [Deltaproteobacteria bacterium]